MSERHAGRRAQETQKGAPRPSAPRRKPAARGGAGQPPAVSAPKSPISPVYDDGRDDPDRPGEGGEVRDRGLRRAMFLAELAEARELRRRVAPRRARAAELHARLLRTFRY
jgi:hypothetical protein